MNLLKNSSTLFLAMMLISPASAEDNKADWHLIVERSGSRTAVRMSDGLVAPVQLGGGEIAPSKLMRGETRTVAHAVSPDGKWRVYEQVRGDRPREHFLAIADTQAKNWRTLADQGDNRHPAWSPDGGYIAFVAKREPGQWHVYRIDFHGKNETRMSREPVSPDCRPCFAHDGRLIYTIDRGREGKLPLMDLVIGDGTKESVIASRQYVIAAATSPDGNRLAYIVPDSLFIRDLKTDAVETVPMKQVNPKWHVTFYDLLWRPDGKALAFSLDFLGGRKVGTRIEGEDRVGIMSFDGGKSAIKTYEVGDGRRLYAWVTAEEMGRKK